MVGGDLATATKVGRALTGADAPAQEGIPREGGSIPQQAKPANLWVIRKVNASEEHQASTEVKGAV
jgi:hypothetical protein